MWRTSDPRQDADPQVQWCFSLFYLFLPCAVSSVIIDLLFMQTRNQPQLNLCHILSEVLESKITAIFLNEDYIEFGVHSSTQHWSAYQGTQGAPSRFVCFEEKISAAEVARRRHWAKFGCSEEMILCRGNLKKLSWLSRRAPVLFVLRKRSPAVEAAARRTNCVAAAAQETGSMGETRFCGFAPGLILELCGFTICLSPCQQLDPDPDCAMCLHW